MKAIWQKAGSWLEKSGRLLIAAVAAAFTFLIATGKNIGKWFEKQGGWRLIAAAWKNTERGFKKHGEHILIGLAFAVGVILIIYLCFPVREYGPFKAIGDDGARNLIILLAGLVGWYFLFHRTKIAARNAVTAEQGLVTDRLGRAIDQLAHKDSTIRVGGILGLEQIAISQPEEREKIARILISFIRKRDDEKDKSETSHEQNLVEYRIRRLDMEAAVSALAEIAAKLEYRNQYNERKEHLCDLRNIDLRGLRFVEADLSEFNLAGADLRGAWMRETKLPGAFLKNVDFKGAYISGANFQGAKGLSKEQLAKAFADDDFPPLNLPSGLNPPQQPPERDIVGDTK